MRLQQVQNRAVVPADVGQLMATTRLRGRPATIVVVIVVILVINLPPRMPPSFFSSPSPPPPSIVLLPLPLPGIKLVARRRC
jgi:hypothetical protein